jgi:hypothetical protein
MKARAWTGLRWSSWNGGHLGPAELAAGQHAAVAGDHLAVGVDQHRHVEAEGLDAARAICLMLGLCARGFTVIQLQRRQGR